MAYLKKISFIDGRLFLVFVLGCCGVFKSSLAAVHPSELVLQEPVTVAKIANGNWLLDFGKVAFGNLIVESVPKDYRAEIISVHFGEKFKENAIDREPGGTIRYAEVSVILEEQQQVIAPPPDKRNTTDPKAIRLPAEWGTILPYRWIEIEYWPENVPLPQFKRQAAFSRSWDEGAAFFKSSDPTLNEIWELCRYSIKATTFAGVYVDGDRERIPYEADAYLNQLSHYYTDNDIEMARRTFDVLINTPTWPTEWASHMIFIAYADWMQTGDKKWLAERYDVLKSKLLQDRVGKDGLIVSKGKQMRKGDIVDWPKGERDGYKFSKKNTVVNAFYLRSLKLMGEIALAIGKEEESSSYLDQYKDLLKVFNRTFFDHVEGVYRDGVDKAANHSSLHANMFPLAFGLVPDEDVESVIEFVISRKMACSVYAAQYLMEALFLHDQGEYALSLITAEDTDRSWKYMLDSGTTITWEAWSTKYKANQDWNHAWGAAPANLFPRFIAGVQALEPGWGKALIKPRPSGLNSLSAKVPTPHGSVYVNWSSESTFSLEVELPEEISAIVEIPYVEGSTAVYMNRELIEAEKVGNHWRIGQVITGKLRFEVK